MPLLLLIDDDGSTTPVLVNVERNRDRAVDVFPWVVLTDGPARQTFASSHGMSVYETDVSAILYLAGTSYEQLGPYVSAYYAALLEAVYADRTLSGTVFDASVSLCEVEIAETDGSGPTAIGRCTIHLQYVTDEGDVSARPDLPGLDEPSAWDLGSGAGEQGAGEGGAGGSH